VVTPEWAFVALGSNVGDREGHLSRARQGLAALPRTTLVAVTAVEETEPIGPVRQDRFLNQMVLIRTALTPHQLLRHCLAIERAAGRVRGERWGPRTLDLDIVRFGDRVLVRPDLVLPHPELPNRPFWLREVAELERAPRGLTAHERET
jgi:2-amino-4-hydroxy-6-hydroxymethyldihydropteridine diphosphokinase